MSKFPPASKKLGVVSPQNKTKTDTWNPHDPCFDWKFDLVLERSTTKIEDKRVPGIKKTPPTALIKTPQNQQHWKVTDY